MNSRRLLIAVASGGVAALALVMAMSAAHDSGTLSGVERGGPESVRDGAALMPLGDSSEDRVGIGRESEGAVAGTEAEGENAESFSVSEAQAFSRIEIVPLLDSYKQDFISYATKWPDGVAGPGTLLGAALNSKALNPNGLSIPKDKSDEFSALNERYLEDLRLLGEHAYELASEAMARYFDDMYGPKWTPIHEPKAPMLAARGRWTRSTSVQYKGYRRSIRFDSADFPFLEAHLAEIDALKMERFEAIRTFIALHGEAPR